MMSASSCDMFPALFHLYMKGGRTAEVCTCLYTQRDILLSQSAKFFVNFWHLDHSQVGSWTFRSANSNFLR